METIEEFLHDAENVVIEYGPGIFPFITGYWCGLVIGSGITGLLVWLF